jgi:hypothetical protein
MLDHITLRVDGLASATSAFTAVLDELEIKQTTRTPSFSVWGVLLGVRPRDPRVSSVHGLTLPGAVAQFFAARARPSRPTGSLSGPAETR